MGSCTFMAFTWDLRTKRLLLSIAISTAAAGAPVAVAAAVAVGVGRRGVRGFPKIMGTFLGVPIVRTIVYWYIGVYIGDPLFWETTIRVGGGVVGTPLFGFQPWI